MKVYELGHPKKRDNTKIPQIKIKNRNFKECGFKIGDRLSR